jgi:hypothetical protein
MRLVYTVYKNGLPYTATSVLLSNAAGTAGVIREDTGAAVVADATPMTLIGTGVYEYTFSEPAEGLSYRWYPEILVDGNTFRDELTEIGQLSEAPDGRYATFEQLERAFGTDRLREWTNLSRDRTTIDASQVSDAWAYAGSRIDSEFRRSRYAVPLTLNSAYDQAIFAQWEVELAGRWLQARKPQGEQRLQGEAFITTQIQPTLDSISEFVGGLRSFATAPTLVTATTGDDAPTGPAHAASMEEQYYWRGRFGYTKIR